MRIDKVAPYWTDEDRTRIAELERDIDATVTELIKLRGEHNKLLDAGADTLENQQSIKKTNDRLYELYAQQNEVARAVEDRYINSHTKKQILADAREIISAFEKEDFLEHLSKQRPIVEQTLESLSHARKRYEDNEAPDNSKLIEQNNELYETMLGYTKESFENCYKVVRYGLRVQYNALGKDKAGADKIDRYIAERVGLWYDKPLDGLPATLTEDIPSVTFSYPDRHLQNLTKASYKIFSGKTTLEQLQQFELDITPNKKNITTSYSVTVDMDAPELKGTENITEYDESVFNSVVSMINANPHGYFTARQLATHLLYGDNPSNSQPSPQQIGAVTKSIEKQRHIDITIDWTDHAKLNGEKLPEGVTYEIKGYMLPVEEHKATINSVIINGKAVKKDAVVYRLLKAPPLLEYANKVGQIASHPVKMLNVPLNLDEQKIVIRDFLLKEIAHLKNKKSRWNSTITLGKIIEIAGEDPATISRDKKWKLLTAIRAMLDYWKQEGYIKAYTENLKGKAVQSFTIETP